MRILITALLLAAAPCFAGEYTVDIKGEVRFGMEMVPGVEVRAEPNPLWGHSPERFERRKREGRVEFPDIEVSGRGVSDEDGLFEFELTIKLEDGEDLPKRMARDESPPTWYSYAAVLLCCQPEGFRETRQNAFVNIDRKNSRYGVRVFPYSRTTGRLMDRSSGKPVAGTEMVIRQHSQWYLDDAGVPVWTVTTDAEGRFELVDPGRLWGKVDLELVDDALAFETPQKTVNHGDMGDIWVVPGCRLRFRVVDAETSEGVLSSVSLYQNPDTQRRRYSRGRRIHKELRSDGEFDIKGIPQGDYRLEFARGAFFWPEPIDCELGPGVNDLGEIVVQRKLWLWVYFDVNDSPIPKRVRASAHLIEGEKPEGVKYAGTSAEAIGLRAGIGDLFPGRWWIQVKAEGWAPVWTIIDLKNDDRVDLTMTRGGTFEIQTTGERDIRLDDFVVFVKDSPADHRLKVLDRSRTLPAGVLYTRQDSDFRAPEGSYCVRGSYRGGTYEAEFEVKDGEHTVVDLSPAATIMRVKVTHDGEPAAGEKVVLVSGGWGELGEIIADAHTDEDGECQFALEPGVNAQPYLPHEVEWIAAGNRRDDVRRRLSAFPDRWAQFRPGDQRTIAIDTGGRAVTWPTLNVELEEGFTILNADLQPELARGPTLSNTALAANHGQPGDISDNNVIRFGPRSPGRYRLGVTIADGDGRAFSAGREITFEATRSQTHAWKIDLHSVIVDLRVPAGARDAVVTLVRPPGDPLSGLPAARLGDVGTGRHVLESVPAGEYFLALSCRDSAGFSHRASQRITVDGDVAARISISGDAGALQVRPRRIGAGVLPKWFQPRVSVSLYRGDERVETGDPASCQGRLGVILIHGVRPGDYTVRMEASGYETWSGSVTIRKGKTAELSPELKLAGVARLAVDGEHLPELLAGRFAVTYEDADGNQTTPGVDELYVEPMQEGARLYVTGMAADIRRIHVKLEGHEEAAIDVRPEPGVALDHKLELQPE